jgi:hypothetical protein
MGSALRKIHDTKKVIQSIQHYSTAVAKRRYLVDRIIIGACHFLLSK